MPVDLWQSTVSGLTCVACKQYMLYLKDCKTVKNFFRFNFIIIVPIFFQKFGVNQSKPEFTVDLKGALIDWASKDKSSKKNVIEVNYFT